MAARGITFLATLLLFAGIPALAMADSGATLSQGAASTGEISGTVRGPEGLPVPGADVTVEGESLIQAQVGAVSGINGGFRFRNLRPGTYTVRINLQGFQIVEYEVVVNVRAVATVLADLQLQGAEEVITVTSEAPMIEIKKSEISTSYGAEIIANIPIQREFVEVQGAAEGATFSREMMDQMLASAEACIRHIFESQRAAVEEG